MDDDAIVAEDKLHSHLELLQLLSAELDQRDRIYSAAAAAVMSRAAILISAASIVATLVAAVHSRWVIVAMVFAVGAAVLGVVAMWPRNGTRNSVLDWRDALWTSSSVEAASAVLTYREDALKSRNERLSSRMKLVAAGFVLFLGTIACSTLAVLFTIK